MAEHFIISNDNHYQLEGFQEGSHTVECPRNEKNALAVREYAGSAIEIPRAEQWTMSSRAGPHRYRIFAAMPAGEPPPGGYPVVYMLDGNTVFGTMVEALRMQCPRPDKTGVLPAVIVGIGYETNSVYHPARYYDYTPAPSDQYFATSDGSPLPEQGGADAFLAFLEEELKPVIEGKFRIDARRQTLFGHSLGGLFALHVLFTRPEAFQIYVAGSPSMHWCTELLHREERSFVSRLETRPVHASLLIGFGELERGHISGNSGRARELSGRLAGLARQGVGVEFKEFEGEGHVSVLPVLINRTLRFALGPEG